MEDRGVYSGVPVLRRWPMQPVASDATITHRQCCFHCGRIASVTISVCFWLSRWYGKRASANGDVASLVCNFVISVDNVPGTLHPDVDWRLWHGLLVVRRLRSVVVLGRRRCGSVGVVPVLINGPRRCNYNSATVAIVHCSEAQGCYHAPGSIALALTC